MTAPRWQLPAHPLRTSVLATAGGGTVAVAAVAALAAPALHFGALYPIKAGVVFAAVMAVVLGTIQKHHPFRWFGLANQMTALRAGLAALVVAGVAEPQGAAAAWTVAALAAAISALDGVDGWLARRAGQASRFGARFDMETDALLIMALAVLAWQWHKAGVWVLGCGLMRYAFVAAGWAWPWLDAPLPPRRRRQAICVVQILGLGVIVAPVVQPPASVQLAALILAVLTYSFLVDVLWLARQPGARR